MCVVRCAGFTDRMAERGCAHSAVLALLRPCFPSAAVAPMLSCTLLSLLQPTALMSSRAQ